MKITILFGSILIASGLFMTNMYTSIVDAKSWGSDIPHSIEVARQYFKVSNPGNFFRMFSPVNQLLGLICIIIFWKHGVQVRTMLIAAFLLYVIAEGLTFLYFFPRNAIMFETGSLADTGKLKAIWAQWNSMNWVRTVILLLGVICSFRAAYKILTLRN